MKNVIWIDRRERNGNAHCYVWPSRKLTRQLNLITLKRFSLVTIWIFRHKTHKNLFQSTISRVLKAKHWHVSITVAYHVSSSCLNKKMQEKPHNVQNTQLTKQHPVIKNVNESYFKDKIKRTKTYKRQEIGGWRKNRLRAESNTCH